MEIFRATEITEDIVTAFGELIPQLCPSCKPPSKKDLDEIVHSENTVLFLAREKEVIGALTLVFYRIPTGIKVWVEDVVVDESMRGKGIAKQLTQHAIDFAANRGVSQIDLTSSPTRIAANKLYQKLGFEKRDTNAYRIKL
ncbi:Ribosomal protein S18 acetylase RimI [Arenibacter nanhaiticus]|uniref:Ribosomal protein S18 acetylase RimI n=1 Tax=Arenibacter nanhaiticus TaxID=558155 RepID=A0A1M6ACH9_9FLAO|nr:GNAT family N-acetyltransferase [Arenibacter nanhaiticus]SHI34119.1 Ribosomal protein S18 acetylase RimI [Arenibacter nanhaiticus]